MKVALKDRLDGVTTFVQVVESGCFAQAADRLALTRSAVGKAIARLETRLGVRLLHRSTRSQTLTAEGQAYYERCIRALAELDAAEADLDSGRIEPNGRLRVSVPEAFGHFCVAPILLNLVNHYPRLQIDISFSDRYVDLIEEGFDLAIRIGELRNSDLLVARRLGTQHTAIGASPAYLARHGTPARPDELEGHTGIAYGRTGSPLPWDSRGDDEFGRTLGLRSPISMDDVQAIAAAAVDGFGVAWLPSWLLARYIRSGELVAVLEGHHVRSQEIYAVWPKVRHLRRKTRVAIDALVDQIPSLISM
jgi:DNA-binding transcriptional LysR family regulator